ncbi:MAG: hypothetical protein ACOCOJ_04610 [Prevotella sp.]
MSKDWTGDSTSVFKALGASNHTDHERGDHDYYATSPLALELFSPHYPIAHKVFEPSCGEGHLSKWLVRHGHDVLSTDLVDRGYGFGGIDFFKVGGVDMFGDYQGTKLLKEWANGETFDILTNPPYNVSLNYVLHALELIPDDGHVLMFLKTSWLEGKQRREQLFDVNPPRYLFQFSGRMVCAPNGDFDKMKKIGSAVAYAWYVFNKTNSEHKCELKWI